MNKELITFIDIKTLIDERFLSILETQHITNCDDFELYAVMCKFINLFGLSEKEFDKSIDYVQKLFSQKGCYGKEKDCKENFKSKEKQNLGCA